MLLQKRLDSIYSKNNSKKEQLNLQFSHHKPLYGHTYSVNTTAISPDQKWLVSAGIDRRLLIWDVNKSILDENTDDITQLQKSQELTSKQIHTRNIYKIDFMSNGDIISGGGDGYLVNLDFGTGKISNKVRLNGGLQNLTSQKHFGNNLVAVSHQEKFIYFDHTSIIQKSRLRSGILLVDLRSNAKPTRVGKENEQPLRSVTAQSQFC